MQAHEESIFVLFAVYGTVFSLYIGYVGASLGVPVFLHGVCWCVFLSYSMFF